MIEPLRVLLIGDTDSQLHYCQVLSQASTGSGVEISINVVPDEGTPRVLITELERNAKLWHFNLDRLARQPALKQFHAIGVFLTGSKIAAFRKAYHSFCSQHNEQPAILFCGFNGVVLENFEEGIAWRLGYDLIALNGPRDQSRLSRFLRHTPFAAQPTVITGLRRRPSGENKSDGLQPARLKQLIFAEQVLMPRRPTERSHMVCILADLARRSPEWQIIIKPRVRPGDRTFWSSAEHISETIDKSIGMKPANLRISYEPIADLLQSSRLMCTVSSTAVFDALDLGCRPVVMADFGWSAKNGTSFFKNSGLLRQLASCKDLDDLDAELPLPNPHWLDWVGYGDRHQPRNVYARIRELMEEPCVVPALDLPGHEIPQTISDGPGVLGLTVNQLRLDAEEAIERQEWQEAVELLLDAQLQRPDNRNIKRRLDAVRSRNHLIRNVRLALSPAFKLKT